MAKRSEPLRTLQSFVRLMLPLDGSITMQPADLFLIGMIAIRFAPETKDKPLPE